MFVNPEASVKLQCSSNYLPSAEENDLISQDDVTGDKIIIRAIPRIANADIVIMVRAGLSLLQLEAVRQQLQDVMDISQLTAALYSA
jgi:hypothetical protein